MTNAKLTQVGVSNSAMRVRVVAVRVCIGLSIVLMIVCGAYLIDRDTRALAISMLSPETRLIALPHGLRFCFALLVVLNLPVAVAGQILIWVLDYWAPSMTPVSRACLVLPFVIFTSCLWWLWVLRRVYRIP